MKKINITDKIGTAIAYKGCVTIEYFDKIDGKKVINAYNEGQTALFNAIVKMLEGRDINNIVRPAQIDLLTSEGSVLSGPVPYVVNPILYVATKEGDKYNYSNRTAKITTCTIRTCREILNPRPQKFFFIQTLLYCIWSYNVV